MYLLGYDIGTSSVKAALVDAETGQTVASAQYPDCEAPIISKQSGWAEQDPQMWWDELKMATKRVAEKAGGLAESMGWSTPSDITEFTVTGPINADDMSFIKTKMTSLQHLDLSAATGSGEIATNAEEKSVYDLQGRKLTPQLSRQNKGIYIVNGKKQVVK